jgi:FkbM family methyltransferase
MKLTRICEHTFIIDVLSSSCKILDLGVNKAEFTLGIKEKIKDCQIFGAEANPILYRDLPNISNFTCINAAVAGYDGEAIFYKSPDIDGSIVIEYNTVENNERFNIKAVSLPKLFELSGFNEIDLLKIDVEGSELEIFESTSADFLKNSVKQITCEFHDFINPDDIPRIKGIINKLENIGFSTKKFSYHTYGDVLFINKKFISLNFTFNCKFYIIKYSLGISRALSKFLRKII